MIGWVRPDVDVLRRLFGLEPTHDDPKEYVMLESAV